MEKKIIPTLLRWYAKSKRDLPWRSDHLVNPYYVFVSEYMLQQTTVPTVKTRFEEFIKKWPSNDQLAKTSETKILQFWSGLGYYSRARNLLKAAKIIHKDYDNKIPDTYEKLIQLPGIGDYTAKAILGIAYNKSVMPLDANIERILARLYALNQPLLKIKKQLLEKSNNFISKKHSSKLIQAFMDYGSIICTPKNPKCTNCKIQEYCLSYKKNIQSIIPTKISKSKVKPKQYTRSYVCINEKNEILVRQRPSKGMLASMLEVPNDMWKTKKSLLKKDDEIKKIKQRFIKKGSIKYSFSHFDLYSDIYFTRIKKNNFAKSKWLRVSLYTKSQLPTGMKKIVKQALVKTE